MSVETETSATEEATAPTAAPAKPGRKKGSKRLQISPARWAEIDALYAAGHGVMDLSRKFGITREHLSRRFAKKKMVKGSRVAAVQAAVKAEVEQDIIDESKVIADRIRETKDQHYRMSTAIAGFIWQEVLNAKKDGKAFGSIFPNIKTLQGAINAIKQAREERFAVLGLDKLDSFDPNSIPDLVVEELTAEQVEMIRNQKDPASFDDGTLGEIGDIGIADADDVMSEGDEPA